MTPAVSMSAPETVVDLDAASTANSNAAPTRRRARHSIPSPTRRPQPLRATRRLPRLRGPARRRRPRTIHRSCSPTSTRRRPSISPRPPTSRGRSSSTSPRPPTTTSSRSIARGSPRCTGRCSATCGRGPAASARRRSTARRHRARSRRRSMPCSRRARRRSPRRRPRSIASRSSSRTPRRSDRFTMAMPDGAGCSSTSTSRFTSHRRSPGRTIPPRDRSCATRSTPPRAAIGAR